MTEWQEVVLADLCERVTVGHVGPMATQYVDEGVPFLRSQNVRPFVIDRKGLLFIGDEFNAKLRKSSLSAGDVVIVRTGYPGVAAVIPASLHGANCADLVVITPSERLNPYVLAALFNSVYGQHAVKSQLVGSAQQHFNVGSAKSMRVRLPDRSGQDRIADVLCALNDLIENNRRRVQVLEEMARGIYREWFVKFRYPGHEDVPLVDSTLGTIPEGWSVESFFDVASFVNGFAFKPSHWGADGRPIIKIKELKAGVTEATPRCADDAVDRKYWVEGGDLLMSWSADLGVYLWGDQPGLLNQHLFIVRPTHDSVTLLYLLHALDNAMPEFRARAQGTTMKHIKRAALHEVTAILPSPALLRRFDETVEPIHRESMTLQAQARELGAMRDLLLPKLVTGQIDVSTLDLETLLEGAVA